MDAELGAKPQTLAMNLIASVVVPVLLLFHLVGPMPTDLGDHDGRLSPCSSPAHCAQEQWNSAEPNADFETLALRVAELPRTVVVERSSNYLHAEASSAFFGFVDDLELLANEQEKFIQVRSVSRLGDSDLGVNSTRLGELHAALSD